MVEEEEGEILEPNTRVYNLFDVVHSTEVHVKCKQGLKKKDTFPCCQSVSVPVSPNECRSPLRLAINCIRKAIEV
jgi:hypothetical protein